MKQPIHPYAVYDSKEAAELLGLNPVTIQRYIRAGKLKATQIGKVYRLSGQALLDLMALDSDSIRMSQDRIKQVENANFIKAKTHLLNTTKGQQFLQLIDKTNDALITAWNPDYNNSTEDELTLKYVGARLLNVGTIALHLCLSGYYQNSFSVQRDLLEIQFLLDLFRSNQQKIKGWREANDKKLKKEFSPVAVRDLLDKRDGFKEKKRAARYQQYCKYASHMTYAGFTLIANDAKQIELGPFYNERKLLNCTHDIAMHYSFAVMTLLSLIKSPNLPAQKAAIDHMKLFHEVFKEELPLSPEVKQKLQELQDLYTKTVVLNH